MEIIQKIIAFIDMVLNGLLVYMAIRFFIWLGSNFKGEK